MKSLIKRMIEQSDVEPYMSAYSTHKSYAEADLYKVAELVAREWARPFIEDSERLYAKNQKLREELAKVTAVAEQCKEDAERYRYMRNKDAVNDCCPQCGYDGLRLLTKELLDKSIDQARKEG